MNSRNGSIPVGLVGVEVNPEVGGRELGGHDHGAAGEEGSEEATEETVDVEERHDQHGTVL